MKEKYSNGFGAKVVAFAIFVIALVFLIALATMLIWNLLVPDIFGLPKISFWQAMGLIILTQLLLGFVARK
jgi:hypothetical protein